MSEPRFVVRITGLPSPNDQRDLLELILAAVSLEVQIKVVLCGEALTLFMSPSSKGWDQLIEQQLVEVFVDDVPDRAALPNGLERLPRADLAKLLEDSIVIEA